MSVDYLLHESSVGYAVFQVIHQPDTVGNRLKEVQDSVQVRKLFRRTLRSKVFAQVLTGSCKIRQDDQAYELCALSVST